VSLGVRVRKFRIGVYDKSSRMDARRKALQAWARLLLEPEAGNVIPFRGQAS
jgi:hypothetical protein